MHRQVQEPAEDQHCPACGKRSKLVVVGLETLVWRADGDAAYCEVTEDVEGIEIHVHSLDADTDEPGDETATTAEADTDASSEGERDG